MIIRWLYMFQRIGQRFTQDAAEVDKLSGVELVVSWNVADLPVQMNIGGHAALLSFLPPFGNG